MKLILRTSLFSLGCFVGMVLLVSNLRAGESFRVLVFSKTTMYRHASITNGIAAIKELGGKHGFQVEATEESTVFTPENLARFQAVVFLSTSGDILDDAQQKAFKEYLEAGGGIAGVHAAVAGDVATEGKWPWYGELCGTRFTRHGAIVDARIVVEDRDHLSTCHLEKEWVRKDEWYNYVSSPRSRTHVLLSLDETTFKGGEMGADHPIAWCHSTGKGRFWYTGLGHTASSFSEPAFVQHLLGGIRFAAGRDGKQPSAK